MTIERIKGEESSLGRRPLFSSVVDVFREQAEKPPGGDSSIASCYRAVGSLIESDADFASFLRSSYEERPNMTPSHFVNLFFRGIQYIKMYGHDFDYVSYGDAFDWEPELKRLTTENRKQLQEILLTKDTATTVYQRYAGPKALVAALANGRELKIADLGCGANYGLRGFELNEPFEQIENGSVDPLNVWLERPLNLSEGLAVDKVNPEDPEVKYWIMACSFYPKELANVEDVKQMEERLKQSKKVRFLQEDLISPTNIISGGYFDAVILSTMLYQHHPEDRLVILEEARRIVNSSGFVIVQDFAKKDSSEKSGLKFENAWFNNFAYRTFLSTADQPDRFFEVFKWADGRCHQVRPGQDYPLVMSKAA